MTKLKYTPVALFLVALAASTYQPTTAHGINRTDKTIAQAATPIIWTNPGNISIRNLSYGPGSPEKAPVAPFTFVEEKKGGVSPKILVRDARGVEWTVKLGPEAQAETVATRLVWAVGYFAEEAYFFEEARVANLTRLSRGRRYVAGDVVRGARFEPERTHMKPGPTWDWRDNPFENTRELNGLKVLMILLNNWDAQPANNQVFYVDGPHGSEARYYVADLGSTLGRAEGVGGKRSKNNLHGFLSTRFVVGVDTKDAEVEFDHDTKPTGLGHLFLVINPIFYRNQVKKEKAMDDISIAHARWIGSLLKQLSDEQLRDAFRAANYSAGTTESYVQTLRERIDQLNALPTVNGQQTVDSKQRANR